VQSVRPSSAFASRIKVVVTTTFVCSAFAASVKQIFRNRNLLLILKLQKESCPILWTTIWIDNPERLLWQYQIVSRSLQDIGAVGFSPLSPHIPSPRFGLKRTEHVRFASR